MARRFQEIVRLYSLPSYSELDPTLVVSVSFCLFFGFMFGDVGHGLALILGTWLMERRGWMGRPLASVMKVVGASAVLFGILYGSVFGKQALTRVIRPVLDDYDAILVDCQPSLGLLTINALTASHGVIIPLETEFFALRGVEIGRAHV